MEGGRQEGRVYGMLNGIEGFLADRVTDLTALTEEELKLLRLTPAAYLGPAALSSRRI